MRELLSPSRTRVREVRCSEACQDSPGRTSNLRILLPSARPALLAVRKDRPYCRPRYGDQPRPLPELLSGGVRGLLCLQSHPAVCRESLRHIHLQELPAAPEASVLQVRPNAPGQCGMANRSRLLNVL